MLYYLENRRKVHMDAIKYCQLILQQRPVDWEPIFRNNLAQPIRNVDLVITVGGDGTLLQASHFMDDTVPILGVNSDPTQIEEVSYFWKTCKICPLYQCICFHGLSWRFLESTATKFCFQAKDTSLLQKFIYLFLFYFIIIIGIGGTVQQ
jgi:hypothetical protein